MNKEQALAAKARYEKRGITIVITERMKTRYVPREEALAQGLEIVEDTGYEYVKVAAGVDYEIAEQRTCERCGEKYLTAAIGEYQTGGNLCYHCEKAAREEAEAELPALIAAAEERLRYFDDFEEHCQ